MQTIKKQTKKWSMKDGTKIRICDMENDHLEKTLMFLYHWAKRKQQEMEYFYIHCDEPTGEGAQMAFEQEFASVMNGDWTHYLSAIFDNMWLEARRRRLPLQRPLCFYCPNEKF